MIGLWFLSRALGLVGTLLLSVVLVLGVLHDTSVVRRTGRAVPRFVLVALHRNLSLLTVVFVALHVVSAVALPYVALRWFDALVPGTARYGPVAAALGAVALDLLLAIVVTSALRHRLPRRAWFVVHWSAYVCWPVAVAHAVANVRPQGTTWWTLAVPALGTVAVGAALLYRRSDRRRGALPLAARGRAPHPSG